MEEAEENQVEAEVSIPEVEIKGLNILVAEDNDSNYLLIRNMLGDDNHLTRSITGAEAVEAARAEVFDVVLMDMRMPIMGGLEATALIREFNSTLPIIALTANAFYSDKNVALAAGCNHFMTKPFKRTELLELLAAL